MQRSGLLGTKRSRKHGKVGLSPAGLEKRPRARPDSVFGKDQEAASLYRQALRGDSDSEPENAHEAGPDKSLAEEDLGGEDELPSDERSSSEADLLDHEDGDAATEKICDGSEKRLGDAVVGTASSGAKHGVHVTVVLENANLELVKRAGSGGGQALLSSDDHGALLRKMKRDPNEARPDITHQCLLTLLDSPLNKAGRLTIYIRTKRNVLISVHPQTRIPRTIRRFSGLMVELLQRLKVRGTSGTKPLLQVIRNPITSHLPVGQRRVLCTYNSDNVVDIRDDAKRTIEDAIAQRSIRKSAADCDVSDGETADCAPEDDIHVLYVVGAMAHGKVDADWTDEAICISEYPLSAATVCSRIMYAYECAAGIL
jgi:rRNA small subunit pseudouridine methyltransferase Nep1